MTFLSDVQTISARFASRMTALRPQVAVAYDNIEFVPTLGSPWCRFTVLHGEGRHAAVNGLYRNSGIVIVQIFTPIETGDALALGIADDVAGIFRGWRSGALLFGAPSLQRVGPDGGWYQLNVSIPYSSDQIV